MILLISWADVPCSSRNFDVGVVIELFRSSAGMFITAVWYFVRPTAPKKLWFPYSSVYGVRAETRRNLLGAPFGVALGMIRGYPLLVNESVLVWWLPDRVACMASCWEAQMGF